MSAAQTQSQFFSQLKKYNTIYTSGFIAPAILEQLGVPNVIIGSPLSPVPSKPVQEWVDRVRYPKLEGDLNTNAA